ncbi:carbon-nitrogen hydrolase [Melampsora americana]|nr:carbon-nitrogen hydrolase [Melampsora americana]
MVFLPEASDFITHSSLYKSLTKSLKNSEFVNGICSTAKLNNCWVSIGVHEKVKKPIHSFSSSSSSSSSLRNKLMVLIPLKIDDSEKCYNTSIIISNQGEIQQAYRKLHLFDIDLDDQTNSNESKFISPGQELMNPISTPIGKIGQLICYDLRFPEVSLIHRQRGAEILIYPSAFTPKTGQAHWETLLRSRAIETQCFVIASAQSGVHLTDPILRKSWGHSMIIDPWGSILTEIHSNLTQKEKLETENEEDEEDEEDEESRFELVEIDLNRLHSIRNSMPIFHHRRNEIYPKLI